MPKPIGAGGDVITKYYRDRKWTLEVGGEKDQWVKYLLCKHENLTLNSQHPCKAGQVVPVCNPSIPMARQEVET